MNEILQSARGPASPQAAAITRLWWLMFRVGTAVFLIVSGALVFAVSGMLIARWDQLDIREPRHPMLTCRVDELRRVQ